MAFTPSNISCLTVDNNKYCCNGKDLITNANGKIQCQNKSGEIYDARVVKESTFFLKLLPLAAYVFMILVNVLANILPINGKTTGEVSDSYPNLFTPTGITFGIWLVIYILLGIQVIGYMRSEFMHGDMLFISLANILNGLWIFAWHYEIMWLSLFIMILLFGLLSFAYVNMMSGNVQGLYQTDQPLWKTIPTSVYYGWISVATVANITIYFVSVTLLTTNQEYWTIGVLVLLLFIGIFAVSLKGDIFFGLVLIWAIIGIIIKRIESLPVYENIVIVCVIAEIFLAFEIFFMVYRKLYKIQFLCRLE